MSLIPQLAHNSDNLTGNNTSMSIAKGHWPLILLILALLIAWWWYHRN